MVLIFGIILLLTALLYALLIAYFIRHWNAIPLIEEPATPTSLDASILIAARNEEEHIVQCVEACLTQAGNKSHPEVIVIDDQSEDDTYDLLKNLEHPCFKLMRLGVYKMTTIKGSKKKAISYGVHHARGEFILTTDADCMVPPTWAAQLLSCFQQAKIHLVSGPVAIHQPRGLLGHLQALDFTANGLINAAGLHAHSHFLCNAANLAYRKQSFLESNAYENNYDLASGDDVHLLDKIRKTHSNGILFLKNKNAIVKTQAEIGWRNLLKQRLRWASKIKYGENGNIRWISAFVWWQRLSIPLSIATALYFNLLYAWIIAALALIIQCSADFALQWKANQFFKSPGWKKWFFPVWLVHPPYFLLIGLLSWLPLSMDWKGRKI